MNSTLRAAIQKIPTREERLGGQTFKYVKLSEVLDLLDTALPPAPETRVSREVEVLRAERDEARARVDWYVKLLVRFWRITPPDVKAPDGRTFQFVDPDPQRSLRIIRDCMELAEQQLNAEQATSPKAGEQQS